MDLTEQSFVEKARGVLGLAWEAVQKGERSVRGAIPRDVSDAISRSINSRSKTYRYVLPTQLLAKVTDPRLDCRSIQATSNLTAAFDARSLAQDVIVPFDRAHHSVLGGAPEPYANNPLRIPAIISSERGAQKYKEDFDDLVLVLEYAQQHPTLAPAFLDVVLREINLRLSTSLIVYPVPNRTSLEQTSKIIASFLTERTGGLRMQALVSALFRALGKQFGIFSDVRSGSINAADASTGSAADVECIGAKGDVVLAVEVKDRQLTLRQITDKLPAVRAKGIAEVLFLIQGGIESGEKEVVRDTQRKEFAAGQNLYVTDFREFLNSCLILLGERGRRMFLQSVGDELDAKRADLTHRQKWRDLLIAS